MGLNQTQITYWETYISSHRYHLWAGTYSTEDTAPQLQVYLDDFSIDQVKVTNARYRRCVEAGVCPTSLVVVRGRPDYPNNPLYDNYPAYVGWFAAQTYCEWVGKRLPTEAEWEKAARGTDGRLYPWGNEWDGQRIVSLDDTPQPVDSRPQGASPYGVLDMIGNRREWTLDLFRPYPGRNELYNMYGGWWEGPAEELRVVRGIASSDFNSYIVLRAGAKPNAGEAFRCVSGPEPPPDWRARAVTSEIPTPVPTLVPTADPDLSDMVYIPAGWFIMGTDDVAGDPEYQRRSPAHVVYLDAYWIDRYEVTRAQYAEFLNALPTNNDRACDGFDCSASGFTWDHETGHFIPVEGDRPAFNLNWYAANAYCRWRGKRLPTEAEWEKAARGTDGRRYPWGNEEREGVFAQMVNSYGGLIRYSVGSIEEDRSPYGVYDMLGNVYEWTADWYDPGYYTYSSSHNPQGPPTGRARVIRSHTGVWARLGLTWREASDPTSSGLAGDVGFRCVYSVNTNP